MTPPPDASADEAAASFRRAADENRRDPLRRATMLHFPNYGQVVVTGDLHGNRANFEKLKRFATLEQTAVRHVILHELIHGDVPFGRPDASHLLMLDAARYKCDFPDQVHFLQSNHELSQLTSHPILKGGRAVIDDFRRGVMADYGQVGGGKVYDAILDFIASFPIAARTPNRVWISHSLPAVEDVATFDRSIFGREIHPADLEPSGPVYQLVWGRRFSEAHVEQLARDFEADVFVIGHIPQDAGFDVRYGRVIILASDHNHGTFLPLDLSRPVEIDALVRSIRKFVEVP